MTLFRKNYRSKTDEELMGLLTNGVQAAFDELYERYSRRMLNFFYRMLNNDREKAEDMLHDLFLKIIERPYSFDDSRTFCAWFYTLAGNMVRNEYRSMQVRSEHKQYSLLANDEPTGENGERIDREIFDTKLALELEKLDPEAQLLIRLRFSEEMSVKQIAEIIDCPEGTVKSRLFYLTKQLGKRLEIYKPEFY